VGTAAFADQEKETAFKTKATGEEETQEAEIVIHPIVLALLVTAGFGLLLAAVSMMLLHTVKGHKRHPKHDSEPSDPTRRNVPEDSHRTTSTERDPSDSENEIRGDSREPKGS